MIRVVLPYHLRTLAGTPGEVQISVEGRATLRAVLEALETLHPVLLGTIRDPSTQRQRPMIRFFACENDLSHDPPDAPLPDPVLSGSEPLLIVGAIAGG